MQNALIAAQPVNMSGAINLGIRNANALQENALNDMKIKAAPQEAAFKNALELRKLGTDERKATIEEQKISLEKAKKFAVPTWMILQKYKKSVAEKGEAVARQEIQPDWDMLQEDIRAEGLPGGQQAFDPIRASQFVTMMYSLKQDEEAGKNMRAENALTGKKEIVDTQEEGKNKRAKEKEDKPTTITQTDRDRGELVEEYKDAYPGLKTIHIKQAQDEARNSGMPFEAALKKIMEGANVRKYPVGNPRESLALGNYETSGNALAAGSTGAKRRPLSEFGRK